MRHSKWQTKIFLVRGYLLNSLNGSIGKPRLTPNSGWAAAQAALVKGCIGVIWKAIAKVYSKNIKTDGGKYEIPKLYNRSETAVYGQ